MMYRDWYYGVGLRCVVDYIIRSFQFHNFSRSYGRKSKSSTIIDLFCVPLEFQPEMKNWIFHHSARFPFISSNIPAVPAYGVYAKHVSELIRYSRACGSYSG